MSVAALRLVKAAEIVAITGILHLLISNIMHATSAQAKACGYKIRL